MLTRRKKVRLGDFFSVKGANGLALVEGGGFSLDAFMAAQADGLYYDFTQTDRFFQETTGQTLADDAGEAIGLALGQRTWNGKTLAQLIAAQPELLSPLDFTSGWTSVGSVGGITTNSFTTVSTTGEGLNKSILTIGQGYYLTVAYTKGIAGSELRITNSGSSSITLAIAVGATSGTITLRFVASDTRLYFRLATVADTLTVTSCSLKAIPGNHGQQGTGSLKPLRQSAGAKGDGGDDNLLTPYLAANGANFLGVRTTVPASLAATQVILGASGPGANRVFLGIDTSGHACGGVGSDSTTTIVGTSDLRGTQADIYLTFDGTTVRLIVNGVVEYEAAQNSTPTTTIPFRLFANNSNGTAASWYAGYIKEAVVGLEFITAARAAQISSKLAA